ncbi:MAG TPA: deoxyguanosinetriphosphate triphosphohydrolase [Mycobacteriales bacterium]|nr:deoxyguanosinetriphosphate triphosphohydrolase [Mycobacteriales bacterium]
MSALTGYGEHERARRVAEPAKRAQTGGPVHRSEFERDRARVLHSYALRRLAATTQVVLAGEDDFPRTRLTHSLEVAQIGREIGRVLGCDPDVVDAAGLAHDLGHPPYGHNGEAALDAVAQPCGGFEGNAQTLRILTRLEAKALDPAGQPAGLNLTRAVLDATAKYPWPRRDGMRKYGVYDDDLPAFGWVRVGAPTGRRCLEAQVMDWADDVAYSVHDVEDGIHSGHISLSTLDDPDERAALCELAADWYSAESPADLSTVLDDLLRLPTLTDVAGYDGGRAALAALKRATSELTGRFVTATVTATRAAAGTGPLSRYAADLVVPRPAAAECALLKGLAARYVMLRRSAEVRQERQREVLTELVALLADRAPDALEPALRPDWAAAGTDAGRLRVVVDQVARLTDRSAAGWHDRLTANALST